MAKSKLYSFTVDGVEAYGKRLAITSTGAWLIEHLGSGGIVSTINPSGVTEVLPYSVGINFDDGNKIYNYLATPGDLAVGDVVWMKERKVFVTVVSLDTKSAMATLWLEGFVLAGAKNLTVGDD